MVVKMGGLTATKKKTAKAAAPAEDAAPALRR
jgi:hypothetical protein